MQIWMTIQTDETDTFDMSTQEVADAVFQALGADESKDFCTVQVNSPNPPSAQVGTPPAPVESVPTPESEI